MTDRQADGLTHQRHADTLKGELFNVFPVRLVNMQTLADVW